MKDKEKSFSRKLFNFFNPNKDGKGVSKDEKPLVPNLKNMPKFYIRNFSRLLTLNVLMIVLLVPAAVAMYMYSVGSTTPSQESTVYSTLYGSNLLMPSAPLMAFLGIFGQQLDLHVFNAAQIYTFVGLAIFTLLIWGAVHVGAAYCARCMVRHEPLFIFSDFFLKLFSLAEILLTQINQQFFILDQTGNMGLKHHFFSCYMINTLFFMFHKSPFFSSMPIGDLPIPNASVPTLQPANHSISVCSQYNGCMYR